MSDNTASNAAPAPTPSTPAVTMMLIIDPQIDFHPGGSLAVAGAIEDSDRIATVIQSKGRDICDIFVTLDTHVRTHIAHAIMWKDAQGNNPNPFTIISADDVKSGKWMASRPDKQDHYLAYCEGLESKGRFQLCIWPEHCIIGSTGHAVYPTVLEALHEWTEAARKPIEYIEKGQNEDTEMYSALAADFPIPSDPRTLFNETLVEKLDQASRIICCGQAMSHCVNFTVRDLVEKWKSQGKDCSRLVLLADGRLHCCDHWTCSESADMNVGCSAVTGFEQSAAAFVDYCQENGVKVMTTDALLASWVQN
jgi:nicotinamidase/pyrazinamidase